MKKLFLLLAFSLLSLVSNAQSAVTTMTGSGDTITNTGTDFVTITPQIYYEQVSFQAVVTKISGTVGGYAYVQASNDNTNFVTVSDSLALTNVTTNTKVFVFANNPYMYYRIYFEGTGTMAAKIYGYAFTTGGNGKRAISNMKSSYNLNSDTCVNSATTYVGLTVANYYKKVSIEAVITKISGTVGGTVTVQGSVDGTNYVTVSSSYSTVTTFTPTDQATNKKLIVVTGSPYKYYRLSYTGTGTMSATIKGYLVPNQ